MSTAKYLPLFAIIILLSCKKESPQKQAKLISVTTQNQVTATGDFITVSKDIYTYTSDGKLSTEQKYTFDNQKNVWVPLATLTFTFQGNQIASIEQAVAGNPQKKTIYYQYTDQQLSKIIIDDAEDSEGTVSYLAGDTVSIIYQQNNGHFFTYRFVTKNNDVSYEETRDENNQLTSKIEHEYDDIINPFSLLGYIDYYFTNRSLHNKTKTTSTYIGSYPVLVPVAYDYLYNNQNLPTQQTITYKTYPLLNYTTQAKLTFEYQ